MAAALMDGESATGDGFRSSKSLAKRAIEWNEPTCQQLPRGLENLRAVQGEGWTPRPLRRFRSASQALARSRRRNQRWGLLEPGPCPESPTPI
jgi:hypothetical protein